MDTKINDDKDIDRGFPIWLTENIKTNKATLRKKKDNQIPSHISKTM